MCALLSLKVMTLVDILSVGADAPLYPPVPVGIGDGLITNVLLSLSADGSDLCSCHFAAEIATILTLVMEGSGQMKAD
jgi:hypothetical protein